MNDTFQCSDCEDQYFTERYASNIVASGGLVPGFSNSLRGSACGLKWLVQRVPFVA